ncbi:MAG TPA: aldo/keto reductase [Polyangiaceae bacterium]|nr:aldo/keto reductase [Polyangiaceae bacterium]
MQMRTLGRSGLSVSSLALAGAFGIDADATERAFHELGVTTFFVSARMKGLVEGVRRLVAAGHRDRLTLVSGAGIPFGFSVEREWRSMAKTLGVERLDVFLLYWVQAHWYVTGNTWPALRKLKEEGKARALGISCHDRPMARALVDELELDVLMIRYNAAHRGAEREIFATLDETNRPGIISYTATRWGRLLKPASGLGPMSAGECYRFALGHPKVDTVLAGARTWDEIAESAREIEKGRIEPARLEEIERFGDAVRSTATGRLGFVGA